MEPAKNIVDELEMRIRNDSAHFHGVMPRDFAIAWRAYLAALMEWNVLSLGDYDRLLKMLPDVPDDPAVAILFGRD